MITMPTNTKQQLCIKPTGFLVFNLEFIYSRKSLRFQISCGFFRSSLNSGFLLISERKYSLNANKTLTKTFTQSVSRALSLLVLRIKCLKPSATLNMSYTRFDTSSLRIARRSGLYTIPILKKLCWLDPQ